MPNIEIHGLEKEKARRKYEDIIEIFKEKEYGKEMVVTIYPTEVFNLERVAQPFIRVLNSCQEHTQEIIEGLRSLEMDIEHLKLEKFYPKKEISGKSHGLM